jgi:hypothetical protein
MTIAVAALVTFLVFVMLGYRFNRDTSTIEQGGLVQFATSPTNANVTIGKAKLSDTTPSKITVNPGNYNVAMSRTGYKEWKKNVDVKSGEVLWLNYAQLVPNTIVTKQQTRFGSLTSALSAPNGDRFALVQEAAKPVITFADITGDTPKLTTITLPARVLPSGKTPTFSLSKWANDSDRLLVDMTYDSTTERLLVDRRDAEKTVNLSKDYVSDIAEAMFDPRSSDRLIIRNTKGELRTANTADDSLSSVIASSVSSMSLYENDAILIVRAEPEGGQSVGYISLGSDKVRVLKRIASTEKTLVALSNYFSEPYLAVSVGSQLDVYKLRSLPSSQSADIISMTRLFTSPLPATADYLSIRTSGRFVLAQYAGGLQTYDIELAKQTITSFKTPVTSELRWLDKYHFYLTNGQQLEVLEFDGANPHRITNLTTGFDAVQSDNGKYIYTINAAQNGYVIQRSQMILG